MKIIDQKLNKLDQEIKHNSKMLELIKYAGEDRVIDSKEKIAYLAEIQKNIPNISIKSQIPMLDKFFRDGFRVGTLNVISGPTGEGKTTFCQTLTTNFIQGGFQTLWFPFEGIKEGFFERFGENVPIFYLPREIPESKETIHWLKDRIWEAKAKFDIKVVFIDHLHYFKEMRGAGSKDQLSLYIGDIVRDLKEFSEIAEITIFLVAHTKSDAGDRNSKHVVYTKDDIRDSSFIKQEASSIMMIYRRRKRDTTNEAGWIYDDTSILNVDKNRRFNGQVGFIKLKYDGAFFTELTENYV